MTAKTPSTPEITILGGGPVGGALACALAHNTIPVRVVDRYPLSALLEDQGTDCRAIAISPSSKNLLDALGVWEIAMPHAQPIFDIQTVHGTTDSTVSFKGENKANDPMGYVVPMYLLKKAVCSRLQTFLQEGLVTWVEGSLQSMEQQGSTMKVSLENDHAFQTSLLIGADGKNSKVRELSGMECHAWNYGKGAIVCAYEHSNDHQGIAWEIFMEEGPFAILPMTGNRSSIVWSVQEDIAGSLKALPDEAFDAIIMDKMAPYLKNLKRVSPRWMYPIGIQFTEKYVDDNLALVGDAAHVMHPLAGQGMNMGFRDVAALVEVLLDQASVGLPFNDLNALEKYQQWRRFDNLSMLAMTDAFDGVFSNHSKVLSFLRERGVRQVERSMGLKKLLTDNATGMLGNLPNLLRNDKQQGRRI